MKKIHFKTISSILLVIFVIAMFGLVCPYLISLDSTDAVILGILLVIISLYFSIWAAIKLWHKYN